MTKRSFVFFAAFCLFVSGSFRAHAQVAPSARRSQFTITAGAIGSAFQPDYGGSGIETAGTAPHVLVGPGAYVDFGVGRWLRFEAEGRWLRFNQFNQVYEDNYMIGPRIPILSREHHRMTPYAKALAGWSKMNFVDSFAYGRFTDVAVGGGVDYRVSNRLSVRLLDFEYQFWPNWVNDTTLQPYGASIGLGYKIF
jgi:hypothetical protein